MPVRAKRLDLIPPYLFGEIARLKAAARAEGKDLIDFGIGDPDQPTPTPIIDRLYEEAKNPETHCYDESDAGDPIFLKQAAQWFHNRYGVEVTTDQMVLLIGSKEGLAHLCWAYIDPGDIALIPDPNYTVPKVQTLLAGGQPHLMPLTIENNFLPDLTAIPTDVAKAAKLLFLNYPHNPTGAIAPLSFFNDAVRFAKEYDLLICNDCAYAEVGYDGYQPPSILQAEGAMDVAIETHSLSKTFNMTGWRIGFAVGNKEGITTLNRMKSNIDSKQFAAISRTAAWLLASASSKAAVPSVRAPKASKTAREMPAEPLSVASGNSSCASARRKVRLSSKRTTATTRGFRLNSKASGRLMNAATSLDTGISGLAITRNYPTRS
jgi:LL-diaminopimelate aminotransferase